VGIGLGAVTNGGAPAPIVDRLTRDPVSDHRRLPRTKFGDLIGAATRVNRTPSSFG